MKPSRPLDFSAKKKHQEEHAEGHAQGGIDVSGRHRLPVVDARPFQRLGDEIGRDHLQQIHHQDPEEDRDGDRRDQLALAVVGVLGLAVDELQADLDEGLPLARHASSGLAGPQPERDNDHQAHQDSGEEGIDVDMPEHTLTLADRCGQVVQVMLDVAGRG